VTNASRRKGSAGDLPFPTSLPNFQSLFPDERACVDYIVRVRWRFYPFNAFRSLLGIVATTEPTTYDALYGKASASRPRGRRTKV
jgi:hypothetical protein